MKPEERQRVEAIRRRDGSSGHAALEDMVWLLDLVERLEAENAELDVIIRATIPVVGIEVIEEVQP